MDLTAEEVTNRFGLLPNFFRLARDPHIIKHLWGFARFAYLDNPLPSLFKERLFVYLSRFCDVRYCIARHAGFLLGLGRPSGDASCAVQSIEDVVALIRRPLPRGVGLEPALTLCEGQESPLVELPDPDSPMEQAIFACATHAFLQSADAARCLNALQRVLGDMRLQYLTIFLAFVRTAHYWTKTHEDLRMEEDISLLLRTHEALARCVLHDPEGTSSVVSGYEALREADRRKDEFLAMLSHELRNPLAPLSSAVAVLRRMPLDAADTEKCWEITERQLRTLTDLVDDLIDISRVSRGAIELRKEPVDLTALVPHAVESVQHLIDGYRHDLSVSLPVDPLYVEGDPKRLVQIVTNLMNNAAKYTNPGGRIALTLAPEGSEAVLRVKDTGIGIAPELLTAIFELFRQVDTSVSRERGGLGVGLALVRQLVTLHGGSVEGTSEGLGHGSEFEVRLPLLTESEVSKARRKQDATGSRPLTLPSARRILVVDDNRDLTETLSMLLRVYGHDVRAAQDAPSAIEIAVAFRPEVVFLDLGLPGIDGYELARRLREHPDLRQARLAALSGYGQEADRNRTKAAGFDAHLVKPVSYADLIPVLALSETDSQ